MICHAYLSDFAAASSSLAEASSPAETASSSINPDTKASGSGEKISACEEGLFFNDLRMISL